MGLLLISRGSFTGGALISECLTTMGGWTCLTREDLIAEVNEFGELATRIRTSIATAAHNYAEFASLRHPYKVLTRLVLLRHVREGNVAYFGYSGHFLLPRIRHAVRVRILAPLEHRIKLLCQREPLTEAEARERIRKVDEERGRWTRFMYGRALRDPEQFDLCLNLERLSIPTACAMLLNAAEQQEFRPTPLSRAFVENCYLSTQVLAALVTDPRTAHLELDATVEDGTLVVEGPYLETDLRQTTLAIAGGVPGVTRVEYREGYPAPFDLTFSKEVHDAHTTA